MAELVKIKLLKAKAAPWGLFTETEHPKAYVWLTAVGQEEVVDRRLLTSVDLERMRRDKRAGFIEVDGVDLTPPGVTTHPAQAPNSVIQQVLDLADLLRKGAVEDASMAEVSVDGTPVDNETLVNQFAGFDPRALTQELQDIQATTAQQEFAKEKEEEDLVRRAGLEQKMRELRDLQKQNPIVAQTIDQPANKAKRALKILARGRIPFSVFKLCLEREEKGKNRKTVIALIRKIMQRKIASTQTEESAPGVPSLSDAYYDSLEEEEEGGVEVTYENPPEGKHFWEGEVDG